MTKTAEALGLTIPPSLLFQADRVAVGRDQVESYAVRKGMPITEVERWLSPILSYDPARVSGTALKP